MQSNRRSFNVILLVMMAFGSFCMGWSIQAFTLIREFPDSLYLRSLSLATFVMFGVALTLVRLHFPKIFGALLIAAAAGTFWQLMEYWASNPLTNALALAGGMALVVEGTSLLGWVDSIAANESIRSAKIAATRPNSE